MQDYEQQLERLKKALGIESDTALAQVLAISQGSISGAKKRKQIPYAWFFQVAEKTDSSLDWLFRGVGSMLFTEKHEGMENFNNSEALQAPCKRCLKLEEKLDRIELQRDELVDEIRQLWKENGELKDEIHELQARLSPSASDKQSLENTA
jgi:hypothetical protein